MQTVTVALGERSYAIYIGQGVLDGVGEVLAQLPVTKRALLVTQPAIAAAYGERVLQSVRSQGFAAETCEVLDAEEAKSWAGLNVSTTVPSSFGSIVARSSWL